MYPMTIAGVKFGGGTAPKGAAPRVPICHCPDANGVPWYGFMYSSWQPARLVEVVRKPYCSPVLGQLPVSGSRTYGGPSEHKLGEEDNTISFYNFHYFSFPLTTMLNMFTGCSGDGYLGFDLMYLSEVDPTWNEDELAFFTNPEVTLFANPVAQAACIPDALAATVGEPLQSLYWCAGAWGSMYPFTGSITSDQSTTQTAGLITARAIAALHRRLLARTFMGSAAMCKPLIAPTIVKGQYKISQLYPLAEANGNHWIGEPSFKWGEWRTIPGIGEDFVEMVWRWNDCCVQTF